MNNIVGLADNEGNLIEEYKLSPYGKLLSKPSEINPYYFSSRRLDPESGLYYFRHRYYDANLGRFLSRDPILQGDIFVSLLDARNFADNNYLTLGNLNQAINQKLTELLKILNLYQYAGNNPLNQKDPLGLHKQPPPCGGSVGGAGGGGGGIRRAAGVGLIILGVALIAIDVTAGIFAGPFGIAVTGAFTGLGLAPVVAFYGAWSLLTSDGGESVGCS
jgi:RHS repeat-associated protein